MYVFAKVSWIIDVFAEKYLVLASAVGFVCAKQLRFSVSGSMYLRRKNRFSASGGCSCAKQPRFIVSGWVYLRQEN